MVGANGAEPDPESPVGLFESPLSFGVRHLLETFHNQPKWACPGPGRRWFAPAEDAKAAIQSVDSDDTCKKKISLHRQSERSGVVKESTISMVGAWKPPGAIKKTYIVLLTRAPEQILLLP